MDSRIRKEREFEMGTSLTEKNEGWWSTHRFLSFAQFSQFS